MKYLTILFFSITVILSFLLFTSLTQNYVDLEVINNSGQELKDFKVQLVNETRTIKRLNNNGSVMFRFTHLSDSHYIVNGELNDGTKFSESLGYLTSGRNEEDTIKILNKGKIELSQNQKLKP